MVVCLGVNDQTGLTIFCMYNADLVFGGVFFSRDCILKMLTQK